MAHHISHNLSPMAEIAKYIKRIHPDSKVVFIGPCTAKKAERRLPQVKELEDCVLTFEELQALFDSREIDLTALPGEALDNASYFGRVFARSGGLAVAVEQALKERGVAPEDFQLNAISCSGVEECELLCCGQAAICCPTTLSRAWPAKTAASAAPAASPTAPRARPRWINMADRPWKKPSATPSAFWIFSRQAYGKANCAAGPER